MKRVMKYAAVLVILTALIGNSFLMADDHAQEETMQKEDYGEAAESMDEVEIVTADTYVPVDREVAGQLDNAAMGSGAAPARVTRSASAPYWKENNGVKSFYDAYGNLMYGTGTKKIIDVSEHNGKINWEKVKASGIDGAIIRLGWGYLGEDKYFEYNISECNRLDIPYGLYLYSYAYDANFAYAEAQGAAEMLADVDVNLSYPFYYDLEEFDPWNDNGVTRRPPTKISAYESIVKTFITTLAQENSDLAGKIHVYSYRGYFQGVLNSPKVILPYASWIAAYTKELGYDNSYYSGEQGWQYTSSASASGISGNVDMSCFSDQFYNKDTSQTISEKLQAKLKALKLTFSDGYISGFALGSNISTISSSLSSLGKVVCTNASGKVITSGRVSSGQTINVTISDNGKVESFAMKVVVYGDVNGDGNIYATDYVKIKNHIMGKSTLKGAYAKAADVNKDGKIYATDYVKVKNSIMGKGTIQQ